MFNIPEISVVMSAFNAEKYIGEAIESILNQTFKNFEFIIINDGSKDRTKEIILSYHDNRIVLIDQDNCGLSKSLNKGISRARSKYIARMDADDIAAGNRLEMQYQFMQNNPDCVVVGSNANIISLQGDYLYTTNLPLSWNAIKERFPSNSLYHSSTMFVKDTFDMVGGYMEDIKQHFEDKMLWHQMSGYGELRNIEDALLHYRLVPSSISNRSSAVSKDMDRIFNSILIKGKASEQDISELNAISVNNTQRMKNGNYYFRIGKIYLEYNFNRRLAFNNLIKSLSYVPFSPLVWFNLMLSVFPYKIIKRWKTSRGISG